MVHNYHYTLVLIIWVTLFFFWNHRIWLITISPYFLAMRLEEIAKIFRETQLVGSLPNGITRNWMIWWQIWRMLRKIVWVVPGTLSLTYTQLSIMYWCYTVSKIIQNNLYSLQFRELKMHHIATVSDYTCKLDNYKPSQLQVLQHVTVLVIEHHHFTSWCCSASLCHGRLFPLLEVRIDNWAASDAREISTKWWMTILWRLRSGKPTIDFSDNFPRVTMGHGVFHIFLTMLLCLPNLPQVNVFLKFWEGFQRAHSWPFGLRGWTYPGNTYVFSGSKTQDLSHLHDIFTESSHPHWSLIPTKKQIC